MFRRNLAGNVNSILDILEDDNQDLPLSDDEDNTGVTYCNIAVYPPTEEPGAESELSIGKRVISVSREEDGSQQVEVNIIRKKLVFEIGWWIYVFVRMA